MEFLVFRRAASALTVVPVLFQRPLDSRRHGITQQVGRRGVALDDFGPGVVRTRVGDGLARVGGRDSARLRRPARTPRAWSASGGAA